jgi:hypothetical protein
MGDSTKIRPYPEFINREGIEGKWEVKDCGSGTASVDIIKRKMMVPFGNEPLDRFLRAHELTHAAFSDVEFPTCKDKIHIEMVQERDLIYGQVEKLKSLS